MSLLITTSRVTYTANGQDTFNTVFRFLESSHLLVEVQPAGGAYATQTLDVDYSVSGANDDGGGVVTFNVPPDAGDSVRITRVTPLKQEIEFRSQGTFSPVLHELAHDKAMMILQEQDTRLDDLEAAAALVDITPNSLTIAEKEFLTDAGDVAATFPLTVAVTGGGTATAAWAVYLRNLDDPSEVFNECPSIQWEVGGTNDISLKYVDGLKPSTNYRLRVGVLVP